MRYSGLKTQGAWRKNPETSLAVNMPAIGCLWVFFMVLASCGQTYSPGDFTASPADLASVPEYTFEPEILLGSSFQANYLTPPQPYPAPQADTYEYFYNYRLEHFGPETEPLITERFGSRLGIKQESLWEYPSWNSCAVGFAASLPVISVIEYGETTAYGSSTGVSESYFYNHLHYLKNLQEGTTYHYRVIIQDKNGAAIALPGRTFTAKTFTAEVKQLRQGDFTHTVEGSNTPRPGLWITEPGVYVLMEDITSDGLGINVKSHNVTIDLNGYTLTYDNGVTGFNETSGGQYNESGSWGIRDGLWNFTNVKVYNGVIKQGATGSTFRGPLFLFHMGLTQNEVAGLTADYHGPQTPGMYTNNGYIHHNLIYDRGGIVTDRHGAVRALAARPGAEVAYNSLRRFRQRGIDDATFVHDNELYCDSFATNSFALGGGDNAVLKNNKIFGMGYHPIGIGWGNNIHIKDNFIYLWVFAPTHRSEEYGRSSSAAGMRVTNLDNRPFENLLVEGNYIVLKVTDHNTGARGIWTTNGAPDKNILYRHNTVKVEALPGNLDPVGNGDNLYNLYYNGDVNNVIAAVTVQGSAWTAVETPDALVFEDNRFISNVNHIIIGEGYGIGSGARFYRSTLEKLNNGEDSGKFFAPVRLGFWYWNTFGNRLIDTKLVGITEEEMIPDFYGGTGKMEVFYGERKTFRFVDGSGRPLARKAVTLSMPEGGITQTLQTDAEGRADFDILSVRYFKYGNSLENGGVPGTPERTGYQHYVFSAAGYRPCDISPVDGKLLRSVILK
ncbi:MAG: hypothetical protein LBP32_02430 [Spirochaetaceae bacterium]|jgi:hypothetical protein|nr:hypothetical protein [Spirochaetaceae bacterium]